MLFASMTDGVTNVYNFEGVGHLDGIQYFYCNTSTVEPKQTWAKQVLDEHPDQLQWYREQCFEGVPGTAVRYNHIKQRFNRSGGKYSL